MQSLTLLFWSLGFDDIWRGVLRGLGKHIRLWVSKRASPTNLGWHRDSTVICHSYEYCCSCWGEKMKNLVGLHHKEILSSDDINLRFPQ